MKEIIFPERAKYTCDYCGKMCRSGIVAMTIHFGFGSIHDMERKDFCSDDCAREWFARDKAAHELHCPCYGDPCEKESCNGTIKEYLAGKDGCVSFVKEHDKKIVRHWLKHIQRRQRKALKP